jgi:hypothetical protein
MTDDRRGWRRLRAAHWLLLGIVVLLVAGGVAVVIGRGDTDPVVTKPSESAAPRPDCAPEIVSTWADAARGRYGFVYRSRCDQVVRELRFRVKVLDPAGAEVLSGEETATGGVLFPGGELAAAGELHIGREQKIGTFQVQVVNFGVYPPRDFSGWAQTRVTGLTRAKPDKLGTFDLTGVLEAEPPSAPICVAEFVLIARDRTGKILYAWADPTIGRTLLRPVFEVGPLRGLDLARTTIYAPQTPRTEQPPRAGMSCNGS